MLFGYGLNYLIDVKHAVDVDATPARTYDEISATKTMIESTEQTKFDHEHCTVRVRTPASDYPRMSLRVRNIAFAMPGDVRLSSKLPTFERTPVFDAKCH